MVTCLPHGTGVGGGEGGELDAEGGGEGSVEQNAKERGGLEGCFVFTSWLIGASDYLIVLSISPKVSLSAADWHVSPFLPC